MILCTGTYDEISVRIKKSNSPIVIYGAGMIGQILLPYIISEYGLYDNLLFFIDADLSKQGNFIEINNKKFEIKSIEYLHKIPQNSIIFLTNSNYFPIVDMFNDFENLRDTEVYIIPIIQADNTPNIVRYMPFGTSISPNIPKKIHYCWFSGKPIPDHLLKCIESWGKYCPDYEIIRWDESNYDVEKNLYMKQAYEAGKWGFVPDIARLDILYNYGGIYIDTDVELIKKLDDFLSLGAFTGVEKWGNVNMGGCSGAIPGHPMIKKMLDFRKNDLFIRDDGTYNLTTCGFYETKPLIDMGFKPNNTVQNIGGMYIFSSDYFHPYDYMSGEIKITDNTHSIHHFNGGWIEEQNKKERERTRLEYQKMHANLKKI